MVILGHLKAQVVQNCSTSKDNLTMKVDSCFMYGGRLVLLIVFLYHESRGATLTNEKLVIRSFLLREWQCTFCSHAKAKILLKMASASQQARYGEEVREQNLQISGEVGWKIPILGFHFCSMWMVLSLKPTRWQHEEVVVNARPFVLKLYLGGDLPWKKINCCNQNIFNMDFIV